ncbi:MAG: GNAT family N-acetyltransferase [Planctomycetota bacterium]
MTAEDFEIRVDDLRGAEIAALLQEHLDSMHDVSPPGGVHALDLDALRVPAVTFWSVWDGRFLAGCGALNELDPAHGELKSMRTAASYLRRGVAARLLEHMLHVARQRDYARLSLETGSTAAFAPAQALYERFGFVRCGPFADYVDNSFSRFMTLELRR